MERLGLGVAALLGVERGQVVEVWTSPEKVEGF